MGDVRGWIRRSAGRSYRDFKWVSSLVQIMWTVIFTCHCWLSAVSWPCWMSNSCEIALRKIGLHLLFSVQLISQWQDRAGEHKSRILSCRYDLNSKYFSLILLWFWATRTDTHTLTHTHSPCTDGCSYMAAWGCSIGFKNTRNICKVLWLIILVLQCNHAIWAWVMGEHEPYGGGWG